MIVTWANCSGGLNAGLSFWLPLADLGAGAVNTTPASAAGSATPTFARATTATTILSTGLIGSVASGTPRSCYSPAGVYLGYLAEEARTNLCLQSADIATTWVLAAATIGVAIAGPDGTTSAKKIQEDNTSARHTIVQTFTKAASALVYSASIYCKQSERTWLALALDDGTNNNGTVAWFNLATGAAGSNGLGGIYAAGLTGVSLSITPAGNGFYRCTLTATSTAGTTLRMLPATATGDGVSPVFVGTTGSGIYAWGAQLEQAGFATSYIPTTTVAVARNADVLTYPSAGNALGTAGTCYAEAAVTGQNAAVPPRFVTCSSSAERNMLYANASTQVGMYDGTTVMPGPAASWAADGVVRKCVSAWSGTRAIVGVNGSLGAAAVFDGDMDVNEIRVGSSSQATSPLNGTIKNVRIWTRALADSQLVSLTS